MKSFYLIIAGLLCSIQISHAQTQWTSNGTNIYNSNAGNVGIGTTTPAFKLQIITSSINGDGVSINNTSNSGYLTLQANGSNGYGVANWANSSILEAVPSSTGGLVLGSYTGNINFQTNYRTTRMTIAQNGNVGIGTATPQAALDVNGYIQISGQNMSSPPPDLGYGLFPYGGVGLGIFSGATDPTQGIGIWTNPKGVKTEVMRILSTGAVGIGTTRPDAKLAVAGTIHATEVLVDSNVPTPDYVFDKDYDLATLKDVKNYIDQNHHLPEIPSAAQVAKEGVNLGEMNAKLLKKIEELTLYLIEKEQQQQQMMSILKKQQKRLTALEQKSK